MYKIKRFSFQVKVPTINEEQYYDVVDHGILDPLDNIADKIGNTGIISIDKKSRNIKAVTKPLKKWHEYKRTKIKSKKKD